MKKVLLAFILTLIGAARLWADCKPRDFYTRSVKIYLNPSQGKPDVKKAEQLLMEALKCYPRDTEVLYTAGQLFYTKKEFPKMMAILDSGIAYYPEFRATAETLRALAFQDIFMQANGYLDKAAKAATKKDSAKYLRQAMDLYRGCMLLDSTATGPYKNLSYAYYALGLPDSSTIYDGLVFKIKPDSARWGYAYAVGLVNQQKFPEAIEVLEKVVKLDSARWEAWGILGQLYAEKDDLPNMAAVYRRLSSHFPDSADFLKQLANYELLSGSNSKDAAGARRHYLEADTLFARYLSKNSADSSAWYKRGLAVLSLKDFARAAAILEKTVRQFPAYPDAWEALAGAYAQMGKKAKEANDAFERAKKLRGESGQK
jgi:tetratricopeptide (TPR) repeat protein